MDSPEYWIATFVPVFFFTAMWLIVRTRGAKVRLLFMTLAILISLPIGLFGVGYSLHLDWGFGHSPGRGVAFIAVFLLWSACVLVGAAGAMVGVANRWRKQPKH